MPTALPFPTEAAVHRLQAAQGYPMISVLLRTTPGATLAPAEELELSALVERAIERVRDELGDEPAATSAAELRRLAAHAATRPTSRGLALFVGDGLAESYRLPLPVDSRTVVDPTFATRDLVRSLTELPPYRVLVLGAEEARVLVGTGDSLTETSCEGLPEQDTSDAADRRGHLLDAGHADRKLARRERYLRAVDAALREDDVTGHLPLFVVAAEPTLGGFLRLARVPVAGTLRGNHLRTPRGELRRLLLPVVQRHVRALTGRDLDRLHEVGDGPTACHGVDDVWSSAVAGRVHLLLVDQAYTCPATLADGGARVERAEDAEAPGVLDDLIDELIEIVRRSDGHVRFVPSDTLTGGVAALLRGTT